MPKYTAPSPNPKKNYWPQSGTYTQFNPNTTVYKSLVYNNNNVWLKIHPKAVLQNCQSSCDIFSSKHDYCKSCLSCKYVHCMSPTCKPIKLFNLYFHRPDQKNHWPQYLYYWVFLKTDAFWLIDRWLLKLSLKSIKRWIKNVPSYVTLTYNLWCQTKSIYDRHFLASESYNSKLTSEK